MDLSPDPNLKELQLLWEKQFWYKSKVNFAWASKFYEEFVFFFGEERKPHDIFRSDVRDWKLYLEKKGRSRTRIARYFEYGSRFYRLLNDLELVEKDFNPFKGMAPKRIRA